MCANVCSCAGWAIECQQVSFMIWIENAARYQQHHLFPQGPVVTVSVFLQSFSLFLSVRIKGHWQFLLSLRRGQPYRFWNGTVLITFDFSLKIVVYVLIFIAFQQCNLNRAKLCTKLKWEKHSVLCQLSMEWYTRAEEKWSVRVREAATDKRITPLLSTPGAVTPEQRNTVKKGKTLIFFLDMLTSFERGRGATWHTIPLCTGQRHVFSPSSEAASWGVTLLSCPTFP